MLEISYGAQQLTSLWSPELVSRVRSWHGWLVVGPRVPRASAGLLVSRVMELGPGTAGYRC